jgi:hypothetical protein
MRHGEASLTAREAAKPQEHIAAQLAAKPKFDPVTQF